MSLFQLFGPPNIEKLKDNRDIRGLIKALDFQKDPRVRQGAAEALGQIKIDAPLIATNRAEALEQMEKLKVIDALILALKDEEPYVRQAATISVVKIGDSVRTVNQLYSLLENGDLIRDYAAGIIMTLLAFGDKDPQVLERIENHPESLHPTIIRFDFLRKTSKLDDSTIAAIVNLTIHQIYKGFIKGGFDGRFLLGHERFIQSRTYYAQSLKYIENEIKTLQSLSHIAGLQPILTEILDEGHLRRSPEEGYSIMEAKLLLCEYLERLMKENIDIINENDLSRIVQMSLKRETYKEEKYTLEDGYGSTRYIPTGLEEVQDPPIVDFAKQELTKRSVNI
jgi:hypothetical protein